MESDIERSAKSVISLINRFLHSVDEMDATILVPHRLMDVPAVALPLSMKDEETASTMKDNNDLFKFYTMLLNTRDEILWGARQTAAANEVCPIAEQLQKFSRTLAGLTDLAVQLKDRYEDGVQNINGRNSPTSHS